VVKLADTQDLGSCALRRGGSSPPSRTNLGSATSSYRRSCGLFVIYRTAEYPGAISL